MSKQQAIIGLLEQGWTQRRIGRETGFDRKTIRRYARLIAAAKSSIPIPGSPNSNSPIPTPGTSPAIQFVPGRESQCEPFEARIRAGLEKGLTAQRIYQDLVADHHFAGNLRAAVVKADWFDRQLNPKISAFAAHYGTVILPTKPRTPRHKGKVEAAFKYVQDNAVKGRAFESLAGQNQFLAVWEGSVADTRIHGTTRQQVAQLFALEQPRLLALPAGLFPVFSEALRHVHLDGHIEVARTYYSVPPEYVRRRVWARWDLRLVRIFNSRMEQIALYARHQPGRFSTDPQHIHSRKRAAIENGLDYLLDRARLIGPHSGQWAETMVKNRGPQGIRVLQGFLQLAAKHNPANLEAASQLAGTHGVWQLRELKGLLQAPAAQEQFQFVQEHPLIRSLDHYQALLPDCFASNPETHPPTESEHESSQPQSSPPTASPLGPATNPARAPAGSGGQSSEPRGLPGTHLPG